MNRTLTKLLVGLFITTQVAAYAQTEPCATDQFHNKLLLNNPQYAQKFSENNQKIANYIQNSSNSAYRTIDANTTYTIPVVFHVIHTGGAVGTIYNPSDANINAMLAKLNSDWANQGFVDMKIQFALAQRSPGCGSTTGINRINGSGVAGYTASGVNSSNTNGADEVAVKDLIRWDHDNYINIWIVNKIDGADGTSGQFTAGYAYFPGAGADVDGVIMLATQTNGGDITLTHEIGHFFNLYHTFQGDGSGSTCPSDADCGTNGDCISDTPPHMRSPFNCPTGTTCSGASGLQVPYNFMDYSNCQDRFTSGQKTRARAALATLRPGLMSSLGCVAPTGTVMTASGTVTSSNPTNTNYMGPVSVSFNGNEMVSGAYSSDDIALVDYSCTQQYSVTAGNAYSLDVKTQTNPQKVFVYIDYNNNGSFTDAGETVYSHTGSTATETHSTTITIPSSGVTTGVPLRMRVWADWYGTGGFTGPTGSIGYGQAEDYAIIVTGGACASVTASISSFTNVTCNGGSNGAVTASASGGSGFTYSWSNGATTASITGLTAGTYTCTVTNSCGNSNSVSRTITQPAAVTVTVTGTNSICSGSSTTLTASGATTYSWNSGQTTAAITVSPSTTTTYTVTGTNASGCTGTGSRTVSINTVTVTVSGTNSICTGSSTTLTASGATTYSWSSGQTTAAITVSPSTTTTYNVTGTNAGGCTGTSSRTVTVNAIPSIASTTPGSRCGTGTVILNATASAGTLGWYAAATGGSALGSASSYTTPSIATTTTYYVSATNNGCTSSPRTAVIATVNANPTVSASASPSTITSGQSSTLTASGASTYVWSNQMTTASITVSPTTNTTYSVTGTNSNGCSATGSVTVTVSGTEAPTTTKLKAAYCDITLSTTTSGFYCDAVASATNYEYEFTDIATSVITLKTSVNNTTYMTLPAALAIYGKTYDVRVRAKVGGSFGTYGTVCQISTPSTIPETKLTIASCDITLSTTTSGFYCDAVASATNYEYEFTDIATSVITLKTSVNNTTYMTLPAALAIYGKTYDVRVRAKIGASFGTFGTVCQISTPGTIPETKLTTASCGLTLSTTTSGFYCDAVASATNYEYEFTDIATSVITLKTSVNNTTYMTLPAALAIYGKTYDVRVRAKIGASFGTFGTVCQISTPGTIPETKLTTASCGLTLSTTTSGFYCDAVASATNYEYEFTDIATSVITLKTSTNSTTYMTLPAALALNGKTYDVRVRAKVGGSFGIHGVTCQISTPNSARLSNPISNNAVGMDNFINKENIELQAYPNPSNGSFTLQSNRSGKYIIMNELGETIRTFVLSNENNNSELIDGLSAGLYFITTTQPDGIAVQKIVITK